MKTIFLIGLFWFVCVTLLASSSPQEVRLNLYSSIRILGAENGYQKQTGELIPWVFGDHRRIYFTVSFFNKLKDKVLDTGDLGQRIHLSQVSRLEFKGMCPGEIEFISTPINNPFHLRLIGAMKDRGKEYQSLARSAIDPTITIPVKLEAWQGVELLFAVDLAASLPAGDYQLVIAVMGYPGPHPAYFRVGEVHDAYDRLHDRLYQAWIAAVFGKEKQERKAMKSLVKVAAGVPLSWMTVAHYFDVNLKDPKTALKYAREGLKRFPCSAEDQNFTPANDSFQIQCGLGSGIFVDAGDMWVRRPCFERYVENLRERIAAQPKGKNSNP